MYKRQKVLNKTAEKFDFTVTYDEADLGGIAIDHTGVPLPDVTVEKCKDVYKRQKQDRPA